MTNKEAIRNLENWELFGKKIVEIDGDLGEAVRVAIKALENQESNQGDLISREALISEFKRRAVRVRNWKTDALNNSNEESVIRADAVLAYMVEVKAVIDNAPTVARPKGEWIGEKNLIRCNQCMAEYHYSWLIGNEPDLPNYCPECGADMRGEENER